MDFDIEFDETRNFQISIMGVDTNLACDNFDYAFSRYDTGGTGSFIFSVCEAPLEEEAPGGMVALVLHAYDGRDKITPVFEIISEDCLKTKPLSPSRWADICIESGELDEETVRLIVDVMTSEQGRETLSKRFEEFL